MGWPSFTSVAAAWWFLLVVPLLLLWLLKLKRPRVELSSLVLWQQVLRDERVNAPLRRLKRSVLLLLQLLALLLLVLALMEPRSGAAGSRGARTLLLLDRSASMGALDRPSGTTRLDESKRHARGLIDGLDGAEEMAIVGLAGTARLACPMTSEKRALRAALAGLDVHDQRADLGAALRMAAAMSATTRIARVVLLSDGNLAQPTGFDLPFKVEYVRVAPGGDNLGITRLQARREKSGWSVSVLVECNAETPPPARIVLVQDGARRADEAVLVRRGRSQRFTFAIAADAASSVEVSLQIDGFDALASDDRAFLWLAPPRPLKARVGKKLASFERALKAQAEVELVETGDADLVITDDAAELERGAALALLVGAIPAALADLVASGPGGSAVVDWLRADPLLEHVELADLLLIDRLAWLADHREADLEQRGYEVVVHGDRGPLLVRRGAPRGRGHAYALLFDPDRSTLPYRVAFPIMISNLVGSAMRDCGLRDVDGLACGLLAPLQTALRGACALRDASGATQPVEADASGVVSGLLTERVGWHALEQGGRAQHRLGVSLLDRDESLLGSAERLTFRELTVAADDQKLSVSRSLAPWLLAVTLAILCVEWWWYRRARAPRLLRSAA